jgi:hypothetical protein
MRGDVLQFKHSHFVKKDARTGRVIGEGWAGAKRGTNGTPDHTAVVVGVEKNGRVLRVLEQNTGGTKIVRDGEYILEEMVDGEVRVFRPVWESWYPPLTAVW